MRESFAGARNDAEGNSLEIAICPDNTGRVFPTETRRPARRAAPQHKANFSQKTCASNGVRCATRRGKVDYNANVAPLAFPKMKTGSR